MEDRDEVMEGDDVVVSLVSVTCLSRLLAHSQAYAVSIGLHTSFDIHSSKQVVYTVLIKWRVTF